MVRRRSLRPLTPESIRDAARKHSGMVAFASAVGDATVYGRARVAYVALRGISLDPELAWNIISGWELALERASGGWTPEIILLATIIEKVDGWRTIDWPAAMEQMAKVWDPVE